MVTNGALAGCQSPIGRMDSRPIASEG